MFTRFSTQENIDMIRVPFTIASLLEVRAMAAEMQEAAWLLGHAGTDPVALIDGRDWVTRMTGAMYEAGLAVYTVAAHHFANANRLQDVTATYWRASQAAGLALNLPTAMIREMKPAAHHSGWPSDWPPRFRAACQRADRAIAYMNLVDHGRGVPTEDMTVWGEAVLDRAGLPNLAEVRQAVASERRADRQRIDTDTSHLRLDDLLNAADRYAAVEAGLRSPFAVTSAGPTPPLHLSDGVVWQAETPLEGETFSDPVAWTDEANRWATRLDQFFDACVA